MENRSFDPLELTNADQEEIALKAKKKMITNVLNCYVGWFDPFCEMIQNALDAVDKVPEFAGYTPKVQISIDLQSNGITVVDNGIGFTEQQFRTFLAPNYSFKDGDKNLRGRKGVGATYLAYAFNYLKVATKNNIFSAQYVMCGGKKWATSDDLENRPVMQEDSESIRNDLFENEPHGTLIQIKCDPTSFPANLSWIGVTNAQGWMNILRTQTAIGQITNMSKAEITVLCISREGEETRVCQTSPTYLMIDELVTQTSHTEKCV